MESTPDLQRARAVQGESVLMMAPLSVQAPLMLPHSQHQLRDGRG